MKLWIAPVIALALVFAMPSCTAEAGSAGNQVAGIAEQITEALKGVTTPETAQSAAGKLGDLVTKLKEALPSGGDLAEKAKGAAEAAMSAVSGKFDFSAITEQISRITANENLAGPLKAVIDQLKGLIGA